MGAKFSKTGKGEKTLECAGDETSDTFDKTSTLPATFKKKDEEVNKAGTLPRGGLDRSTSFSKRFRKSMTRLVGHKKVSDDAKPVTEPDKTEENAVKEDDNAAEKDNLKEEVETKEEVEDDLKTAQKKARAQFFENMYSSEEPVNIPKPPRSTPQPEMEKVTEEDEIETVSVSLIGTPVVKLIDKHEEESGTQQESAELKTDAAAAGVEVADLIAQTKQEMVTSESKLTEVHEEVNDESDVQLVEAEETTTAEPMVEKITESTTEIFDAKEETNVTRSEDKGSKEEDTIVVVDSEQKIEHSEKMEHESKDDDSETLNTIEGVNSEKEAEKDEQPTLKESGLELIQEDEKSDLVIEAAVIQDVCTEETASKEFDGNMDEANSEEGTAEQTTSLTENITEPEKFQNLMKIENEDETKDIINGIETFEIVTNDMIDDMDKSGASSLEAKCDSRNDDLSSEGGITTDEGIEGSDDDEKEEEKTPKKQICETIEPILVTSSQ